MALTIENPDTERLATEVARMAGESPSEAIRKALEERKQRLAGGAASQGEDRIARWRRYLEEEVWPKIPPSVLGKPLSKEEQEEILGLGPEGV
jgi:antitoxin VapB